MRQLLLGACQFLLVATLLLWAWLLWEQAAPDVLLLPAGIVYLGLSLHRIPRLPTALDRLYAFQMTKHASFALLMLVVSFHVISFVQSLGESLGGPATRPILFEQFLQELLQGSYWIFGIVVVFMTFFQLPWVERRLNTWFLEHGDNR